MADKRSLDDILADHDLTQSDLKFHCPRKMRDEVAEMIVDEWYLMGRALVSESKLKAIRSDTNLSGPEEKAVATLDAWGDENGENATVLKLVEALYHRKKRSIIDTLCREVERRHRPTSAVAASTGHQTPDIEMNRQQQNRDQPKFNEDYIKQIITKKSPVSTPEEYREHLEKYIHQTTILLHTVKDEEMLATCHYLSSPLKNNDVDKPIRWFDENISLILGIFAGHKAALIQTRKGADCRHVLLLSLQYLPNVKLIIGLGFAYGRRNKSNLGDVLVSTCVDGVSNFRIDGGHIQFDEGVARYTNPSTATENVFATGALLWTDFKCSTTDRESKAHTGVIISSPVLLNDQKALDNYLRNNPRFIGGEMEGQELAHAQQQLREKDKRELDFVIIKGVADFGDGTKEKNWQLTASLAAASYAENKLQQTDGKVYFISGSIAGAKLHHVGQLQASTDSVPYCLQVITGRIKKCYGCGRNFRSKRVPLTAPHDLVVSHKERRVYWDKKLGDYVKTRSIKNAYYHLDVGCIQPINKSFKMSNLVISDLERSRLTDTHKDELLKHGLIVD